MMLFIAMALLVSLGLWAFVRLAPHWGLVDQPNSRSLHTTPTVVSGGIVPMLVLAATLYTNVDFPGAQAVALMTLALTAIGLLDDRRGLHSGLRFLCYLGAGLALCWLLAAGSASITALAIAGVAGLVHQSGDFWMVPMVWCLLRRFVWRWGWGCSPSIFPNTQLACCLPCCLPAEHHAGGGRQRNSSWGGLPSQFVLALMGLMAFLLFLRRIHMVDLDDALLIDTDSRSV